MRDKVKRFISILMTALMLVNLMPVGALAEGFTISNSVQSRRPEWPVGSYKIYVYAKVLKGSVGGIDVNKDGWYTLGYIDAQTMPSPGKSLGNLYGGGIAQGYNSVGLDAMSLIRTDAFHFVKNQNIPVRDTTIWSTDGDHGFKACSGATDYNHETGSAPAWHLDILVNVKDVTPIHRLVFKVENSSGDQIGSKTIEGKWGQEIEYNIGDGEKDVPQTITTDGKIYKLKEKNDNLNKTFKFDAVTKQIEFYYEHTGSVQHTLTINYKYEDGNPVEADKLSPYNQNPYTQTLDHGTKYSVTSPDIPGYTADKLVVDGKLTKDTTVTVIYRKRTDLSYTVNYYWNGTTEPVAESKTVDGQTFNTTVTESPANIDDCTITPESYAYKTITIKANSADNVINFYYYKNVELTANSDTKTYNGSEQSVSGFTGAPEEADFSDITVGASGTDADTYPAAFADGTVGKVDKTEKYKVTAANNGKLVINPRAVTLTSETASKPYDGTALTKPDVKIEGSFVEGEVSDVKATGSVTNVSEGEVTNEITYTTGANFKESNYNITKNEGKLSITANETEVVVKIAGDTAIVPYDGKKHTVERWTVKSITQAENEPQYDASNIGFEGTAIAEGTDAGTYVMGLKDTQFKNTNGNFKNVTFVVEDGQLVIEKRKVTLTSETASKPYDGTPLTKPVVAVTGDGFVEGEVTDIKATGSVTNVSEGEVTNEITYTTGANFKESNYNITKNEGKLSITANETEVVVKIAGDTAIVPYDGKKHTVERWTVKSITQAENEPQYDASNIGFEGTAIAEGTDAGTYVMGLKDTQFKNTNGNFKNVTFVVEKDGQLVINPRSVTLTSGSAERVYNGEALTKDEVTASTGENEGFVKDEGAEYNVTGSQTEVGESKNTFSYTLKDGTKATNYNIELALGTLKVTPVTDKVTVTITENSGSEKYDGTEKTVTGYTVSISNPLYKATDFTFGGNAEAKGTDAGTYNMELKASDFTNNNTNFAEVKFVIVDGSLTISPRSVTLTSATASKVYDGTPLTNDTVAVGGDGFAKDEGATYKVTGSQTVVGSSENTFTYELNKGTEAKNYNIELKPGTLEVTPVETEVIVTITGRTDEMPYDGKEHSVFGYDLTVSNALYNPKEDMQFNGIDGDMTAKGTDAGTYPIGLTAEDFTNKSKNFSKVTFVVTDGYVKINPRAVTLTSETAGKTYDGTALEKPVVTVGGDGFVEGQVTEIKATGSVTNAGSVANTITFTPNKETFKEGNYAITKTEGTLTINKRSVLITSQSATKTYDGSALTRPAVTITGDGFVPGELAKAEATGSITNVGSTPNAIQYTTTGAFNAANYSIALSVGTLTVTERPQPEPRRTFNLTISYVYQNGKRAAASYNRGGLKNGETFDITSPVIAGYTASETVVSGTIYNRDIQVTVIYTADGVNLDDYGVPLGLGNITMNVGDCFE